MTTHESRIDYALGYAALGWTVIPLHFITPKGSCSCNTKCKSPGKHPLTKNGLKEASSDQVMISEWFKKWPQANIGIATGSVSGVLALDIDPRHGGDDSFDLIVSENGRVPDDVMAVTGSGGRHYLFKYPGTEGRSTTNLWAGIDTRGDGGYIVVAPSNHISGKSYFWDAEADPLAGAILPDAPRWLLSKLAEKPRTTSQATVNDKTLPPGKVKSIRAALGYLPAEDRDQWRTVGMALHASGAGDQAFGLWCEWSGQSDKFDLKDQRRVWDSFKPGGGITLAKIFGMAKQNGFVSPENERETVPPLSAYAADLESLGLDKPYRKKPKRKTGTGENKNPGAMLELLKRYVFLKNHNRIYDTVTRNELTREGFDGAYLHQFSEGKPSAIFLSDPEAIKVDGVIYLPGVKNNPVHRNGAVLWNIWCDPGVSLPDEATKYEIEPWLDHLGYLFPNKDEQKHLLDWQSFVLQRPDIKINHALLVMGVSRVGKDMLFMPLRYGLGSANICEPSATELKETYTDYLHHAKLVIFQEIQTFEGLNLENKLKPMLAAPPNMLRVRLFGRGFYETPNIVQAIFMSNYKDAMHVSEGDGRYFAVWTDAKPMDAEYYTTFAKWLSSGGSGMVVRWLLDRDVGHFCPEEPPPSTRFKSALLQTSKSPLRHQLEDMVAAGDYPFNVDCVRSIDVSKTMRDRFSSKAIGSVLSEVGCEQMTCKRSTGKREKVSLFAVRNMEGWRKRSAIKWLEEYDARRD